MLGNNQELEVWQKRINEIKLVEQNYLQDLQNAKELFQYLNSSDFDACLKLYGFDKVEMLKILSTTAHIHYASTIVDTLISRNINLQIELDDTLMDAYLIENPDKNSDEILFKEGISNEIKEAYKKYADTEADLPSAQSWSSNDFKKTKIVSVIHEESDKLVANEITDAILKLFARSESANGKAALNLPDIPSTIEINFLCTNDDHTFVSGNDVKEEIQKVLAANHALTPSGNIAVNLTTVDQQALEAWAVEGCLAAGLPVPDDLANYGF
jgi:hypothetical protein